jgi:hypothetical protein
MLLGPMAGQAAAAGVFNRRLGTVLDGESGVLSAARRFALVGLQWSSPMAPQIELRTRRHDGPWSPWMNAAVTGHDADLPSVGAARYGEPVWVGAADLMELRTSGPVHGVRIHFVAAAPTAATAARLPLAGPGLDAGPGQPPIIARSAWAGDHAPPRVAPGYGSVKLAFIHHTVSSDSYSAGAVPAMLLAIYQYHVYVRGFHDIAYNFIVDLFGRIWEARAGGVTEPVVGAHAGGYNLESTGVAMLGTFSSVVPSSAALHALERLLAWKCSLHGIPVLGKVRVEVDPAGAVYTPFRPGQRVRLPRVSGHRDGDQTDCPGSALYYRLPSIRPRIAALAGTPAEVTLEAPSEVVFGATATLRGRLGMRGGGPLGGAPIEIQTVSSSPTQLAVTTTGADGTWSVPLAPTRGRLVRAVHPVQPAAVSAVVRIGLKPVIELSYLAPVLRGTVRPARRSVLVDVYELTGAHRRRVSRRRVAVHGGGFTTQPNFRGRHGQFEIVVRVSASDGTLAGASSVAVSR